MGISANLGTPEKVVYVWCVGISEVFKVGLGLPTEAPDSFRGGTMNESEKILH